MMLIVDSALVYVTARRKDQREGGPQDRERVVNSRLAGICKNARTVFVCSQEVMLPETSMRVVFLLIIFCLFIYFVLDLRSKSP